MSVCVQNCCKTSQIWLESGTESSRVPAWFWMRSQSTKPLWVLPTKCISRKYIRKTVIASKLLWHANWLKKKHFLMIFNSNFELILLLFSVILLCNSVLCTLSHCYTCYCSIMCLKSFKREVSLPCYCINVSNIWIQCNVWLQQHIFLQHTFRIEGLHALAYRISHEAMEFFTPSLWLYVAFVCGEQWFAYEHQISSIPWPVYSSTWYMIDTWPWLGLQGVKSW